MADTIRFTGVRSADGEVTIGVYHDLRVDAELHLDLRADVAGDHEASIDMVQMAQRLARALRTAQGDPEILAKPMISLTMVAGKVLQAAMYAWQVREATIRVHAKLQQASNCASLDGVQLDEVMVQLHRVADELTSHEPTLASLTQVDCAHAAVQPHGDRTSDGCADADACEEDSAHTDPACLQWTTLIALQGSATHETQLAMLTAIMQLEQDRATQIEGISALYHVAKDTGDAYSALVSIASSYDLQALSCLLFAIRDSLATPLDMRMIGVRDYEALPSQTRSVSASSNENDSAVADSLVLNTLSAAQLEPWMQLEPDASIDGDPLAYRLAFATDANRVGLFSERWIMGENE